MLIITLSIYLDGCPGIEVPLYHVVSGVVVLDANHARSNMLTVTDHWVCFAVCARVLSGDIACL